MRLFSYDSKFSQIMLKLCYGCYLNLLWMVCSLPVFTAGAATAALYDVTLRLAREEEPPLTRQFFKAFRKNFRQIFLKNFPKNIPEKNFLKFIPNSLNSRKPDSFSAKMITNVLLI